MRRSQLVYFFLPLIERYTPYRRSLATGVVMRSTPPPYDIAQRVV